MRTGRDGAERGSGRLGEHDEPGAAPPALGVVITQPAVLEALVARARRLVNDVLEALDVLGGAILAELVKDRLPPALHPRSDLRLVNLHELEDAGRGGRRLSGDEVVRRRGVLGALATLFRRLPVHSKGIDQSATLPPIERHERREHERTEHERKRDSASEESHSGSAGRGKRKWHGWARRRRGLEWCCCYATQPMDTSWETCRTAKKAARKAGTETIVPMALPCHPRDSDERTRGSPDTRRRHT